MKRSWIRRKSAKQRAFENAYKLVRLQVLERDDWRCRWCERNVSELSVNGMHLEVNHVIKRSADKLLRLDPDNLISLCDPGGCHDRTEEAYAKGRLCITSLGNGQFDMGIVYAKDKFEARRGA